MSAQDGHLSFSFSDAQALERALKSYQDQGLLLLEDPNPSYPLGLQKIELYLEDRHLQITVEIIQLLDGVGAVCRLASDAAEALQEFYDKASAPQATGQSAAKAATERRAMLLSMGIEELTRIWSNLSNAEKIKLASAGGRSARSYIARGHEKHLHAFLLRNKRVGIDEIAILAQNPSEDPSVLREIAKNKEWVMHLRVARALVLNPKLSVSEARKLLRYIPERELRQMAKSAKLRPALKREVIKSLSS